MASSNTENVIEKDSGLLEKSGSADRSITISDPVQVNIQVVTAGHNEDDKDHTSSESTSTKTVKHLAGIVEQLSQSNQKTITINDPVQVTITLVPATKTASSSSATTVESNEITKTVANTQNEEVTAKNDDKPDTVASISSNDENSAILTSSSASLPDSQSETLSTIGAITKAVATPVANDQSTSTTSNTTTPSTESSSTTTTIGAITEAVATPVADDHSASTTNNTSTPTTENSSTTATTVGAITKAVASPVADDHSATTTSNATTPSKETTTTTTMTPATSETGSANDASNVPEKPSASTSVTSPTEVQPPSNSTTASPSTTATGAATDTTTSTEPKPSSTTDGEIASTSGANSTAVPNTPSSTTSTNTATTSSTTPVSSTTTPTNTTAAPSTEPTQLSNGSGSSETGVFTIPKGSAKNLTDYQRRKAEYFFKSNLDKENKNSTSWKDIEDYLLSHVNSAGKVGANDGAVEADLSRGARNVWEHIFDQLPSADGKRDSLTLDQFLDTWAALVDYIVKNGQLPPSVQNLVDQALDLHGTKHDNDSGLSVSQATFDKLYSNLKLDPASVSTAYKALTDNGTKPLDRDRLTSLVRAAIASSDDSHPSKYLLPGFVKDTKSEGSTDKTDTSQTPSKPVTPSPSPASTDTNTKESESKNANEKPDSSRHPPVPRPVPQPMDPRKLDNDVRQLLKFYGMGDVDFVEVDEGPRKHVVQINPNLRTTRSPQPGKESTTPSKTIGGATNTLQTTSTTPKQNEDNQKTTETPKTSTLEERVAHGDVQVGPTIPASVDGKDHAASSSGVRQVFPDNKEETKSIGSTAETPNVEKTQGESVTTADGQSHETDNQTSKSDPSASSATETSTTTSNTQQTKETPKGLTHEEEERIVGNIIKQVTPLVEELVAKELRKLRSGSEVDDDAFEFIPFPFMLARGGPVFSAQGAGPSNQGQFRGQQSTSQGGRGNVNISGGMPNLPPELLMSMMTEFGGIPPTNVDPRFVGGNLRSSAGPAGAPHFPSGVEGFMMFVDDNGSNIPSDPRRGGPRF